MTRRNHLRLKRYCYLGSRIYPVSGGRNPESMIDLKEGKWSEYWGNCRGVQRRNYYYAAWRRDVGMKEEKINFITSVEANKYIWQQVKQLLAVRGYIVCPNKSKYMVRLREHFLQMVYQEILYGATELKIIVIPAWTYQDGWFFVNRISLHRSNTAVAGLNLYSEAAYRQSVSLKAYYDISELVKMWDEAISPQLQKELIEYFDNMDFYAYAGLCENRGDNFLKYRSSCDAVRLLAIGYNSLWMRQYEKGKEHIQKAIIEMREIKKRRGSFNGMTSEVTEEDSTFDLDLRNGEKILTILESCNSNIEEMVEDMLCQLEKDAMEKTVHIALNEKNETVKIRNENKKSKVKSRTICYPSECKKEKKENGKTD